VYCHYFQKDIGLILAARFSLYSGDFDNAHRISKKLLYNAGDNPSTPSEMEALSIDYWATILEVRGENDSNYYNEVSRLERIDRHMQDRGRDCTEVDILMAWAACRVMLGRKADAINVLNKVIAVHPNFAAGLTEKALLLAASSEWDQALDTAQRALDIDDKNFDALKVKKLIY
jgi:tetratricopeptide (TPR) repeat protein